MAVIKLCPACHTQNAASAQRCSSCSAMLIGVDLSEAAPSADPGALSASKPAPASSAAQAAPPAPATPSTAQAAPPTPSAAPAAPPATGVSLQPSTNASLQSGTSASPQPGTSAAVPRRCPHADCGQLNPAGAQRCLYCDRPLEAEAAAPAFSASLHWPWNERSPIADRLLVGREAPGPASPATLASRLARDYGNVSRRHAELRVSEGALWVVDLGSRNGTFVNDTRIAPNQPVRLVNGATLRFAANLVARVCIGDER